MFPAKGSPFLGQLMADSEPPMEYRTLGDSGLKVSVISLGTWFNVREISSYQDIIQAAFSMGINFFDTAESYHFGKAEQVLGEAIAVLEIPREQLVISTKLFFGTRERIYESVNPFLSNSKGLSRKHVAEGMRDSLKRLKLDYVDIVFAHRYDEEAPMEEICRGFNDLIEKGLAFYWGTSEWPAFRIVQAHELCDKLGLIKPIAEQAQYNMFVRDRVENEYQSIFQNYRIGLTAWSPLCGGILTGKYVNEIPKDSRINQDTPSYMKERYSSLFFNSGIRPLRTKQLSSLGKICDRIDCKMNELALAWVLSNPNTTTAIIGASTKQQVIENVRAVAVLKRIDERILSEIKEVLRGD